MPTSPGCTCTKTSQTPSQPATQSPRLSPLSSLTRRLGSRHTVSGDVADVVKKYSCRRGLVKMALSSCLLPLSDPWCQARTNKKVSSTVQQETKGPNGKRVREAGQQSADIKAFKYCPLRVFGYHGGRRAADSGAAIPAPLLLFLTPSLALFNKIEAGEADMDASSRPHTHSRPPLQPRLAPPTADGPGTFPRPCRSACTSLCAWRP